MHHRAVLSIFEIVGIRLEHSPYPTCKLSSEVLIHNENMLSTAIPTCRSVMITSRVHFISSGALCSLLSLRASKILRSTSLLDAFSGTTNRSITAHAEREPGATPHDVINGKWALAATHIEYKDSDLYTGASDEDLVALERRLGYV